MKASLLTERIQLWRRDLVETEEGDLSERWSSSATVWAYVRLKGVDGDAFVLEVLIRPTSYVFQRIKWRGIWADCPKSLFKTRECVRFFAKTRSALTGF